MGVTTFFTPILPAKQQEIRVKDEQEAHTQSGIVQTTLGGQHISLVFPNKLLLFAFRVMQMFHEQAFPL